jgi:MYXO-CTERM domain-containing protein
MRKFMLTAAGVASVALAGQVMAEQVVEFNVDGPGGGAVSEYELNTSWPTIEIELAFTNNGGWTWAGDLLIGFMDPDGNSAEFGGYDLTFGFESFGDFAASWDSSSSGTYTATLDLSFTGLNYSSGGMYVYMMDGYSGGAETDNWSGTFTFQDMPAPGALAVLGLAGFAARRRKR